jgi:hypothetical protein
MGKRQQRKYEKREHDHNLSRGVANSAKLKLAHNTINSMRETGRSRIIEGAIS